MGGGDIYQNQGGEIYTKTKGDKYQNQVRGMVYAKTRWGVGNIPRRLYPNYKERGGGIYNIIRREGKYKITNNYGKKRGEVNQVVEGGHSGVLIPPDTVFAFNPGCSFLIYFLYLHETNHIFL